MEIGDRVRITNPGSALPKSFLQDKEGVVVSRPYQNIWYVCLDEMPHSRIGLTESMVQVLQ